MRSVREQGKYTFERLECAAVLLSESASVPTQIALTWHHDFESTQLADIHASDFPVPDWDEIVPDHSWKAVNSSRFNYLLRQYQSALLTTEFARAIDEEFPLAQLDEALMSDTLESAPLIIGGLRAD